MRAFSQTKTMKKAGLAALLTTAACAPKLFRWANSPEQLWLLLGANLWAAFFLWGFVFAWNERESGQKAFVLQIQPGPWLLASIGGLIGAFMLRICEDPMMRLIHPSGFPENFGAWAGMILFTLAFEQLFVCFAPFAFFIRLFHRRDAAFFLTVLFGVLLLWSKLSSAKELPSPLVMTGLLGLRMMVHSISTLLYLHGGVLLTWWWIFLLQTRHLATLMAGG